MKKKFLSWNIANTTTRRFKTRLLPSLIALQNFKVPYGEDNQSIQKKFAKHLESKVESYNIGSRDDYDDLARKSIACLKQFGLVFPNITKPQKKKWVLNNKNQDEELLKILKDGEISGCNGSPWEITPLGKELIDADNNYSIEKVFKKIFILYRLPSSLDTQHMRNCSQFSPLKIVLDTLKLTKSLSASEFALFILMNLRDDNAAEIKKKIKTFRDGFKIAKGRERKYAKQYFIKNKLGTDKNFDTIISYVDTAYQYFKLTGLFFQKGKTIYLKGGTETSVERTLQLIEENQNISDQEYIIKLWSGNLDFLQNEETIKENIKSISDFFKKIDIQIPKEITDKENNEDKLIQIRDFQDNKTEELFYLKQQENWKTNLDLITNITKRRIELGERILDRSPEIFEWAAWRTLLSINNISCQPNQTRFFEVDLNDEELLPLNDAKSGCEDLYFQFENYNLIVEVTYTESSRQDSAERYSVREHLVKRVKENENNKDVYALFIAPSLDLNTLQAFNMSYFLKEIEYSNLKIVPLTVEQYSLIFEKIMNKKNETRNILLKEFLDSCLENKPNFSPKEWKNSIEKNVESFA